MAAKTTKNYIWIAYVKPIFCPRQSEENTIENKAF